MPSTISVQKICRVAKNEGEVREALDTVWKKPEYADNVLDGLLKRNVELYRFEKTLEGEDKEIETTVSK